MKKYQILILAFLFPFAHFSQSSETSSNESKLLSEISENACKCIDSIEVANKRTKERAADVHACIDKQASAYQLGLKLGNIKALTEQAEDKKDIKIVINTNPDSNEYKKYYYEIERHLMANCPAIKNKIASNDSDRNTTDSAEALKYYNLAIEESKSENYAKAIEYYKKAVIYDDQFAFAYDNMGICHRRLNQYDEAIAAYEKSLKINPNGLMPLQNIGIVYLYKKEYKKAIKAYERLAKIDDKNPEVFYGIGNIYAQYLFEYEKALENLCVAYNIYVEQKSPYRTDAEKLIQVVYNGMKKEGKLEVFNKILEKHHISQN